MTADQVLAGDKDVAELLLDRTDALLPAVLNRLEAQHERSQQTAPGHSSMGDCRRKASYGHHGHPADDGYQRKGSVQAWIGTAVHSAFLPVLRQLLHPARIELATTWQPMVEASQPETGNGDRLPPITGHVDLYRRRSRLALDLKTVSRHGLNSVKANGARWGDLLQLHANAASLSAEGKPCDRIALLYVCTETSMDRADAEGFLWVQDVQPEVVDACVSWWAEVTSAPPEQQPRDERGPGLSWVCDSCPWLRSCWGEDAVPGETGAQAVDPVESDVVVSALAMLHDATTRKQAADKIARAAEGDREFAEAMLAAVPEGDYKSSSGQGFTLSWPDGQLRLDQQAAQQLLTDNGLPVPKRRSASRPKVEPL